MFKSYGLKEVNNLNGDIDLLFDVSEILFSFKCPKRETCDFVIEVFKLFQNLIYESSE